MKPREKFKWWKQRPTHKALIDELIVESGGQCSICGVKLTDRTAEDHKPSTLTVDHIKPLHKGGKNTKENLRIVCKRCNEVKSFLEIKYRDSV